MAERIEAIDSPNPVRRCYVAGLLFSYVICEERRRPARSSLCIPVAKRAYRLSALSERLTPHRAKLCVDFIDAAHAMKMSPLAEVS